MKKFSEIILLVILVAVANAIGFYVYSNATFRGGIPGRNFGNFVAAMIGVFLALPVGLLVGIIPRNSFLNKFLKVISAMFLNGLIPCLFLKSEIQDVGLYKVSSAMWIWVSFEILVAGIITLIISGFTNSSKINPNRLS
jgi:hypothetical protein